MRNFPNCGTIKAETLKKGGKFVRIAICDDDGEAVEWLETLLRKEMVRPDEHHIINFFSAKALLHTYQQVRPLGDAEFEDFCIRLAYPEKFWKLANHYFNSRKTWIPEKNLQKLEILDMQEKKRREFVKFLH